MPSCVNKCKRHRVKRDGGKIEKCEMMSGWERVEKEGQLTSVNLTKDDDRKVPVCQWFGVVSVYKRSYPKMFVREDGYWASIG